MRPPSCAVSRWRPAPSCRKGSPLTRLAALAALTGKREREGTRRVAAGRVRVNPISRSCAMPRYRLTLEYDGRAFVGWQRQDNGPSVQAAVEEAIRRFCGEVATVHAAGRTDSGVHALGQVAHVDLSKEASTDTVRDALNAHLRPAPVAVLEAARVGDDFHARFSAIERRYLYRIVNRRAPLTLDAGRAWHVTFELDAAAMHRAAQRLVGRHDFTSFRAAECQAKSPVKTLDALDVAREGDEIRVTALAR